MATRIEQIIQRARYTLADPDKNRYSDARLLALLSSAQKDIARHTRILKDTMSIALTIGVADYDMPEDTWLITRAMFNDIRIPMVSHDRLDERNPGWMTDTAAKLEAIVYDRRNMTRIKVYPIPNELYYTNTYQITPVFGVTTNVDGVAPNQTFGVLTGLDIGTIFQPSVFGVVTDLGEVSGILRIDYIKDAPEIQTTDDELVLSKIFDTALEYFVVGRAFLDDLDVAYQNKGVSVMTLYQREIDTVGTPTKETDGTQSTIYTPTYTSAFDL